MDLEEVVKLLELMESHGLDEVEIEQDGVRVRLKKGSTQPYVAPMIAASMPMAMPGNGNMAVNGNAMPDAGAAEARAEEEGLAYITSPMVGTLYRASSPDTDVFVHEGDIVTADTVVCIIEAMKVMNEVRAEVEGEVVSIHIENGESVEYGQPIMSIRPKHSPG